MHIVPNELDEDMVDVAFARGEPVLYLRHLPKGIWIRMYKYAHAPFGKRLQSHDSSLSPAETQSLMFVEARTSDAFHFRNHTVTRAGFALSHGRVIPALRARVGPWTQASSSIAAGSRQGHTLKSPTTGGWIYTWCCRGPRDSKTCC